MRAILIAKRFLDTGFELDVEFQQTDGTPITTKTLAFSGADPNMTMQDVRDRMAIEAIRLQVVLDMNDDPSSAIGTDLLA